MQIVLPARAGNSDLVVSVCWLFCGMKRNWAVFARILDDKRFAIGPGLEIGGSPPDPKERGTLGTTLGDIVSGPEAAAKGL